MGYHNIKGRMRPAIKLGIVGKGGRVVRASGAHRTTYQDLYLLIVCQNPVIN